VENERREGLANFSMVAAFAACGVVVYFLAETGLVVLQPTAIFLGIFSIVIAPWVRHEVYWRVNREQIMKEIKEPKADTRTLAELQTQIAKLQGQAEKMKKEDRKKLLASIEKLVEDSAAKK